MGVDYEITLLWGCQVENSIFSYLSGFDMVSYLRDHERLRGASKTSPHSNDWIEFSRRLNADAVIHRSGSAYNRDTIRYYVGIQIAHSYDRWHADITLSCEKIERYQRQYDALRLRFEMLCGLHLPEQGRLQVCVHEF